MSNGRLKAQYNRVRTSVALQGNNMWANTIGIEQDPQAGSNAAIEASLRAPTRGGGGREARRVAAQQLIEASGYQPSVTDYQGLLTLAKAQGGLGTNMRGACKRCGGLGHLTKQCTNFLTGHVATQDIDAVTAAAASAGAPLVGLLPDPDALSGLSSDLDSSSSSSSSDSSSSSSSDSGSNDGHRKRKRSSSSSKKQHSSKQRSRTHESKDRSKDSKKRKHKKHSKSKREGKEKKARHR